MKKKKKETDDNSKWMKSHHLLAHEKPGIW